MRAVVQRVSRAQVTVKGEVIGSIAHGLMVLVGVAAGDTLEDATLLARKVAGLRIFPDSDDKMNLDVSQAGGDILAISQFTLMGDCRKGRRPSFFAAGRPEDARPLYEAYCVATRRLGLICETGIFQASMQVELVNDGPVTLLLDSKRLF